MLKQFIIRIIALSMVLMVAILAVQLYAPQFYLPVFPYLVMYFIIVNMVLFIYLNKTILKGDNKKLHKNILLFYTLKFMIYLFTFLITAFLMRSKIKVYAVGFFSFYLIYTVFAAVQLTSIVKLANAKKQ